MNAVYGEVLLHFPEQFRKVLYFNMGPKINDGYGPRTDEKDVWAVLHSQASRAKDSNGNWIREDRQQVWTQTPLQSGRFIQFESVVFRIITDQDWPTQGGFYVYEVEKVVGSDGTPQVNPNGNTGGRSFT